MILIRELSNSKKMGRAKESSKEYAWKKQKDNERKKVQKKDPETKMQIFFMLNITFFFCIPNKEKKVPIRHARKISFSLVSVFLFMFADETF